MSKKFDLAVLGGGPGGYVAAIRASQLGYKTVVIEQENLGGICLNWGCIPTKALLKSAEVYDLMKNHSKNFGIKTEGVDFDFDKIIKRSRTVSTKIVKGVEYLFKKNNVERIKGFGKLKSANAITIFDDNEKEIESVEADKIIIATGARPKTVPAIPVDREKIITSKEAMTLESVPKELIVIGAGAIGIEFAYFYNIFGSKVTVIEMLDNILPVEDVEISKSLESIFRKRKIDIFTSAKVLKAAVKKDKVEVVIESGGEEKILQADKALNSIGVTGNVEGIGLDKLGISTDRNFIQVDKNNYRTNIENIYAIGDVIGPPWLAHVASAEGIHCVEKFHGKDIPPIDYESVPGCTYCQPQVGSIGLTESKAVERGYRIKVGKFPFSASGKSSAIGEREGFVKIIFDEKYGEILGVHILGSEATEMIAEAGIAKSLEADFNAFVKTIHAHPTLAESMMEAAANAYGEAIHI